MDAPRSTLSTIAATVFTVALGVVMIYLGLGLVAVSVAAFTTGELVLAVGAGLVGFALVFIPVAILVSQVRAMLRSRQRARGDQ